LVTSLALLPPSLYQKNKWMIYFQYSNTVTGTDVLNSDAIELHKLFIKVAGKEVTGVKVTIHSSTLFGIEIEAKDRLSESEIIIMTREVTTLMNDQFNKEIIDLKELYQNQLDKSLTDLAVLETSLSPELKWEDKDYLKAQQDLYNAKINLIIIDKASQSFDSNLRPISRIKIVSESFQGMFWAIDLVLGLGFILFLSRRKKS
jgi:hypothetical protein